MIDVTTSSAADSGAQGDDLIEPDDYPRWVPGRLLLRGTAQGPSGATVRAFNYGEHDVTLPPVRDYLIVAYHRGTADMRRQLDDRWSHEQLGPGDVSLLTRAVETRWRWRETIDVVHVHLTQDLMRTVCQQMYERDISEVQLKDELKADDPAVFRTALALAAQAKDSGPGSRILEDTLACQMAVHLLRRHTEVSFREFQPQRGMSPSLLRLVEAYVHDHIDQGVSLDDLAGAVGLSRWHFARRFRDEIGTTPHEFVLQARVEAATHLLARSRGLSLSQVATACGFSDQSHMTRVFRSRLRTTPGRYRAES